MEKELIISKMLADILIQKMMVHWIIRTPLTCVISRILFLSIKYVTIYLKLK